MGKNGILLSLRNANATCLFPIHPHFCNKMTRWEVGGPIPTTEDDRSKEKIKIREMKKEEVKQRNRCRI